MSRSAHSAAHEVLVEMLISTRKNAALTQRDLAQAIGKSQNYISHIETGQRRVDVLEFYVLAVAMKADPAALYAKLVSILPQPVTI